MAGGGGGEISVNAICRRAAAQKKMLLLQLDLLLPFSGGCDDSQVRPHRVRPLAGPACGPVQTSAPVLSGPAAVGHVCRSSACGFENRSDLGESLDQTKKIMGLTGRKELVDH